MPYSEKSRLKHPFVNPLFKRFGNRGANRRVLMVPCARRSGQQIMTKVGMSCYMPHNGKRQAERQARQKAAGLISF